MKRSASRLALTLGVTNLAALVTVAALSAGQGFWGIGDKVLPPDALPASEVVRKAERSGMGRIYGIDVDQGTWLVRAVDPQGKRVEMRLDPRTGKPVP
jgi:hypothetical protein